MKNFRALYKWPILGGLLVVFVFGAGSALVRYGLTTTTAIVIRHAEKAPDGNDAPLSQEGQRRALDLAHVVEGANVTAAYCCTTCRRTLETVQPLNVPITRISDNEPAALADDILSNHAGQTVVVAGHSNTVPLILQGLGSRSVVAISENEYDNLYVVIVHEVRVLRMLGLTFRKVDTLPLKYGART
jgi:broad specificity phosphatase PhoE